MTMFLAPYTAIADIDGSPLDAGFIFFGEFGKNPESFPIPVYWDADFAIPAAQPIRTRNGYPIRNGSPCKIYLKQAEHSLVIKNKNLSAVLVEMNNKGISSSLLVRPNGDTVETSLTNIDAELNDKQQQIDEKPSQQYVDEKLDLKAPQETTYTKLEVDSALSLKAPQETTYTKAEVDTTFAAYVGGRKGYTTLALAQAGQSTLTANTVADVTNDPDPAKNGTYQWNGTTLTKSAYDPLTQAKGYTDKQIEERWAFSYSIKHPVIIRDKSTGQGVPLLNRKGNLVGTLEGDVLGKASEVGGGGFEIKLLSGRRDALLIARDSTTGQGVVLIDAMGRVGGATSSSHATSIAKPIHTDRVLSDMIGNGAWRGDWSPKEKYISLDVVRRTDKYYVCYSAVSPSEIPPNEDPAHWEYLPLATSQGVIVEDNFRLNAGLANNRSIQPNQQWKLSGPGFANGVVANEYMTSATNTYYYLVNFTHKITEISTVERFVGIDGAEGNHTLAISYMLDWHTVSGFQNMWHINWGTGSIGSITYWKGGSAASGWTTEKIKISKGLKADKDGVAYKHTAKLRGNFIFGYLDEDLAYIHCDDLIGEMTANAKAFYVQNHFASLGQERIEKVIVKSGVLS
ncbi:hypothetical protein [Acinetobacter wanghuae]|uniref:hypothetical protein n=1 Tax=Acinetobacter wanghuae TaxID=2662362 RepID=UPI003AF762AB